jgi:WD40 repeat protein
MNECLRVFSHTDFVTSIQFHPIDDKYFLSGSLDEKVRLWSIPEQTVVDWVNIHEMVTAVCFSPDGKKAVIGSYKGKCRFYSVEGNQFEYITQMGVKNTRGKNSRGKKITGLQYMPGVDRFLLVTSNDSRIRMYDGFTLCCKYKGHRNANSQIASGFSPGGGFIACGSEDGCVCIWSTINTFIPSVNPFYTGYRSDKNSSFETFLAHDDIVTSAVFAPLQDDPTSTIARNLGIAPPTKAAEALVKPSLKRLGLNKSKADQEREEAQRAGETAMKAAAAVGQNIITSGFSGEIRIFENAGLPIWL